ncbi:MAG: hypothetical protein AAFX06_15050 [Planctomycetota bacterium]
MNEPTRHSTTQVPTSRPPTQRYAISFSLAVVAQIVCACVVAWLSLAFRQGTEKDFAARPILSVVTLWSLAFVFQMLSLRWGLKLKDTRRLAKGILLLGVSLRLIFLFTPPIQEIDLYRYLWDGAVVCEGISPYRFSPAQLREVQTDDEDLRHLQKLLAEEPGLADVHSRVHYPQVTTVYPPISQCVFALTALLVPKNATEMHHVVAMKFAIVLFDLGTMFVVMCLLRRLRMHSAWAIIYCWSPLVLKEFANSGHLDSIAVFFTVLAFWFLKAGDSHPLRRIHAGSAASLALGIGAKLYPIVLVPLCFAYVWKLSGARRAAAWATVLALTLVVAMAPMFAHRFAPAANAPEESGLETFLSRWEMNDLLFMVVEENLRPDPPSETNRLAWFAIVPNQWRIATTEFIASTTGLEESRIPFLATRAITSILFLGFALWIAIRVSRDTSALLPAAFVTVAWFWLLSPTQNPWYWTWALPFVVFHRNRGWLLIAAVAMIYYCRFWFDYHPRQLTWLGYTYQNASIFDFAIVWLEFLPALVVIGIWQWRMRSRERGGS